MTSGIFFWSAPSRTSDQHTNSHQTLAPRRGLLGWAGRGWSHLMGREAGEGGGRPHPQRHPGRVAGGHHRAVSPGEGRAEMLKWFGPQIQMRWVSRTKQCKRTTHEHTHNTYYMPNSRCSTLVAGNRALKRSGRGWRSLERHSPSPAPSSFPKPTWHSMLTVLWISTSEQPSHYTYRIRRLIDLWRGFLSPRRHVELNAIMAVCCAMRLR